VCQLAFFRSVCRRKDNPKCADAFLPLLRPHCQPFFRIDPVHEPDTKLSAIPSAASVIHRRPVCLRQLAGPTHAGLAGTLHVTDQPALPRGP